MNDTTPNTPGDNGPPAPPGESVEALKRRVAELEAALEKMTRQREETRRMFFELYEEMFPDGHRFDVGRTPNDHLGFGIGPHFCLGANLARREITVVFRELLTRLPDLEITGAPEMLRSNFIHGIKRMPCAFTPGGA